MSSGWTVYDYEVEMFNSTLGLCKTGTCTSYPHPIPNAIVESLLLHTRILVDILLSRDTASDAVILRILLPGFGSPKLGELKDLYGRPNHVNSPCWTLNKRLAHSTSFRSDKYDYAPMMSKLEPLMSSLLTEIENERTEFGAVI